MFILAAPAIYKEMILVLDYFFFDLIYFNVAMRIRHQR